MASEPLSIAAAAEYLSFLDWLAAFDPDQPRDERGRFSSLGSVSAHAASKKAHRSKTTEDHEAAAKDHDQAAANHAAEADRRRLLAKRSKSSDERQRHERAADNHERRAAEHEKLAGYHRDEAATAKPKEKAPTLKALGIAHNLDASSKKTVESAIKRGGFQRYLAKSPLREVRTHLRQDQEASGIYYHARSGRKAASISIMNDETATGRVEIMRGKAERLGLKLGHEDLWTVSSLAKTAGEMRERSMTHELGHHLHVDPVHRLSVDNRSAINDAYYRRVTAQHALKPGRWVASAYARSSPEEWFAETHAAYVWHGKELAQHDPDAHALMRKVRQERGIE